MWEPCHTRRKIKETGPVLFTPPGSSMWDLTHPGTAGFLKAAVQNQDPRVGIGAPSLCLFYFVLHHYLMDGRGLRSVWRAVMSYCLSSLARNQLSILYNKNIRFKCFPMLLPILEVLQLVTLINLEHFILVMNLGILPSPCRALIEYNCSLTSACPLLGKVNFTNAWRGLMPSFTSLIRIMARHKFWVILILWDRL